MKNIHDILKELGIEITADKKAEFDTTVNENYKTVVEADKLRMARDTYKTQLDEAGGKLKEFEGIYRFLLLFEKSSPKKHNKNAEVY